MTALGTCTGSAARSRVSGAMTMRFGSARSPICRGSNRVGINISVTVIKLANCK
ncbi:hypothetical protein D3C85_1828120 [compost metagenome]